MIVFAGLFVALSGWAHAASCPNDIENESIKKIYTCSADGQQITENFHRNDGDGFHLLETNHFEPGTKRISEKRVHKAHHGAPATYKFQYRNENDWDRYIASIEIADSNGEPYRRYSVQPMSDQNIPVSRLNHMPPEVLVVDTGFEWTHPLLISKHHYNPEETLNGLDDDQDGWVDNITTIKGVGGYGGSVDYVFNENEALQIRENGEPISHGTFVSSVVMKDVDHTSFIGASGALESPAFLFKLLELVRKKGIRFTNMSFGFGDKKGASFIDPDGHEAISAFLKSSTDTLHTVAAGNHGINFDESDFSEYPACLRANNVVTVGALNTGEIETSKIQNYRRSTMSSHGVRCVDVLAPGENVYGAGMYPDTVKASGTSVASPFALNLFLKVHAIVPDLSPAQYRELVLKTVYVPKGQPFSVRSGGILFPERSLEAARRVALGFSLSDSIKGARQSVTAVDENTDWEFLTQLWKTNRL